MTLRSFLCVMALGLVCSAHALAWDDVGDGWYAERVSRKGSPGTAMIRLKRANYIFMAEYDCTNRLLLSYDMDYVGLPVPNNKSASALFEYACTKSKGTGAN
jgi:hypothetical protein